MSAKDLLDSIRVESPCQVSWDAMIGNDQVRFCEHCNLTVNDLSQLTRKRAQRLVRASKGRLCIRYHRRPDGSLVTRSTPQKLYGIGRRASRIKVNLKNGDGHTALMGAAMVNNSCVLNTLLQVGARVDEKNDAGQTALMLAAFSGPDKERQSSDCCRSRYQCSRQRE